MTTNLPEVFAGALVGFVCGVLVGQFVSVRRVHHTGDPDKLKWGIEQHPLKGAGPLGGRIFRLALVVLFLAATAFLVNFTVTQRACNDQLWDTIAARAQISSDTELARKENDEAVHTLFSKWIELSQLPAEQRRDQGVASLQDFERTYADNIVEQQENARKRAETPYPRC